MLPASRLLHKRPAVAVQRLLAVLPGAAQQPLHVQHEPHRASLQNPQLCRLGELGRPDLNCGEGSRDVVCSARSVQRGHLQVRDVV